MTSAVRIPDLIDRKRRGHELSRTELESIVLGYTRGHVPDYQVAAWLMAVCCRGMSPVELTELTEIMASSGRQLDLASLGRVVVDKHSTGGVGDKTTLVVAPLVAACGVPFGKMSGRGLGFTGGTLDKLESIPGLRVHLDAETFVRQLREVGLAIVGQSADLAPADGKLYALRDVTGTVESIPLIASSIMSKKLAAGAQVIVLDIKVGSGAFMHTTAEARELAEAMVQIGRAAGRDTAAYVTDMSQPIGRAVGNSLELVEAIQTLRGDGPSDLQHLAVALAAELLLRAGATATRHEAERRIGQVLAEHTGLERLAAMVRAQGGDERCVWQPGLFPRAKLVREVLSEYSGLVTRLDARVVAQAALVLGAGRAAKGDAIDPSVGVILHSKVGDRLVAGQPLATIHAREEGSLGRAEALLRQAFRVANEPAPIPPLIHWRSA